MAKKVQIVPENYDSFDFAENCKWLFESCFSEDIFIPKELKHSAISKMIDFNLENVKSDNGIYQLLKFGYLQNFFPIIKTRKVKSRGRPKIINTISIPKRIVLIPVKRVLCGSEYKFEPTKYDFRGRTTKLKSVVSKKNGAIRTNKMAAFWLNKEIDEQMLSEFKMIKHQRQPFYFAYAEIRKILTNISLVLKKLSKKNIYEADISQRELYDWLAQSLNWRLKLELDLWKLFLETQHGSEDIFKSALPYPSFNSRNIRDMLESAT